MKTKRPYTILRTKSGATGKVYHDEVLPNGKTPVYLDDGRKIQSDPKDLKLVGYAD